MVGAMLKYKLLEDYANVWIKSKDIHGFLVEGPVGMGKTYTIERILKAKKKPYCLLNTYITPLTLYITLYNFRNHFIVIDDVLELFKNKTNSGLLIAALQSEKKERLISYNSTTEKLKEIPRQFYFNGKIAIICNKLPKRLDHLKSRCYQFELKFNYNEKLEILEHIARRLHYPKVVVDFIKQNTSEATPDEILNIRLLLKLHSIYKTHPKKWKELGIYLLKKDSDLYLVKQIIEKYPNVRDQIKVYQELTGKSRASFYRTKQKLL